MIIEVKTVHKSKEGAQIVRKDHPTESPIFISWDEFNKNFHRTSWANHYWTEIDEEEVEKSLEKISFISKNITHFITKTRKTKELISEYFEMFGDNQEDLLLHLQFEARLRS